MVAVARSRNREEARTMADTSLIDLLRARADPVRAAAMAAYHKTGRTCLGLSNPEIDAVCRTGAAPDLGQRLGQAAQLWSSGLFEARIAAAKLLENRRLARDERVWALVRTWVPEFDLWAIADHVSKTGSLCLTAAPERLDELEPWTAEPSVWTRRAALVMTLPWARMRAPAPADRARRERILGWAASYVRDPEWFIQKAVGWWLRELSARDPARVRSFIAAHGAAMKAFARREALRNIGGT
jgi:3-methyladenine DNA glycosylase AlkD